jgi:hypothetical protein
MVTICPCYLKNLQRCILYLWVLYGSHSKAITSLNSISQLICVMVKCGVLFEVRTEFLTVI